MKEKKKTKVLIADNDVMFCAELNQFLNSYEEVEVVKCVTNGRDAYHEIINLKPDVVVIGIVMSNIDGLGVIKKINETFNKEFKNGAVNKPKRISPMDFNCKLNNLSFMFLIFVLLKLLQNNSIH